ncbi:hypothetical protein [Extensimonas perlucida]|uniref:hypothetical protein n=1 Tax=Extensimonas perlucida TaxID=2590786 RepID=UPI00119E38F6|nr:hypothetical protein [Extensimonas perlucida]
MIQKKTPAATEITTSAPNTAQFTDSQGQFNTLRSAFARQGHSLHRVAAPDGTTAYWAERWGLARYLPSLHDAALFLAQIGGRL